MRCFNKTKALSVNYLAGQLRKRDEVKQPH